MESDGVEIAVLGDAFVDVYCPLGGDKLPFWGGDVLIKGGIGLKAGGSASNTACQLASLCKSHAASVSFHTGLGSDAWAAVLQEKHRQAGTKLHAKIFEQPVSTGVCVVISGSTDRAFMTSHGAMDELEVQHLDIESLSTASHLHIGGYFSLPLLQPSLRSLLERLRSVTPHLTVSLDTNFDPQLHWGMQETNIDKKRNDNTGREDREDNALVSLLSQVDYFLPNESEACGISGKETLEDALDWLTHRIRPGGAVLLTCGEQGVMCKENGKDETWRVAAPTVDFVDSTGAGDAFNAGFLFERVVRKRSLEESARGGVRAGSIAVQSEGACDVLISCDRLDKMF